MAKFQPSNQYQPRPRPSNLQATQPKPKDPNQRTRQIAGLAKGLVSGFYRRTKVIALLTGIRTQPEIFSWLNNNITKVGYILKTGMPLTLLVPRDKLSGTAMDLLLDTEFDIVMEALEQVHPALEKVMNTEEGEKWWKVQRKSLSGDE